ncbi:FadR/GntR family transcriptional regulator [Periweissella fabalis]|uniref:FadR family transcriptional regulator n=1 Tax=Periweissella fabalis TaxID=1070421 RepID=A0A7X6S2B4_9LACO|nr:FCD domain-containing protein [Periweissella fabalis]MCM0599579.1 FadR family transcriptional regulator [Periweissella fabalis]NKZ23884.1 FadR family transcriptional regulator [Periweissella fabalis]
MASDRSLVNKAIDDIMAFIKTKELKVNDKLPREADLATALGIGRSTLREAVKILAFADVLTVKQGSGTFINATEFKTEFTPSQLMLARTMIEETAVIKCAQIQLSNEELLNLKELLFKRNKLLAKGKFLEYVNADLEFHRTIVNLTQNPFLIKWFNSILEDVRTYLGHQVLKTTDFTDNTDLHNQIFKAIVDRDVTAAKKLIRETNDRNLA